MVGVENGSNTLRALIHAKEKFQLKPLLVTSDFSPNLTGPIREVFGENVHQIDGFHVMQELNNGIRRDVLDYRAREFKTGIKELYSLRDWITRLQKSFKTAGEYLKTPPRIKPRQLNSIHCFKIARTFTDLLVIENSVLFENCLQQALDSFEKESGEAYQAFFSAVRKKIPVRGITVKGRDRLKLEILKKLKTLFHGFRKDLEAENARFHKNHWLLFFQPENLTDKRKQRLNAFLIEYPALQEYRDMTLLVGEIYRRDVAEIDGHQIDDLVPRSRYSLKLQTAIRTLKAFKDSILRFVEVFKKEPALTKACRANMEHYNTKFKAPFRHGLNRTKHEHLIAKLRLQLGCEVRSFFNEDSESTRTILHKT